MIVFTKAYQTSDGKTHATLSDAQQAELIDLYRHTGGASDDKWLEDEELAYITKWMVDNADKVVDILTTKANSKPRARKLNGGTKKRKPIGPGMALPGSLNSMAPGSGSLSGQ